MVWVTPALALQEHLNFAEYIYLQMMTCTIAKMPIAIRQVVMTEMAI